MQITHVEVADASIPAVVDANTLADKDSINIQAG